MEKLVCILDKLDDYEERTKYIIYAFIRVLLCMILRPLKIFVEKVYLMTSK